MRLGITQFFEEFPFYCRMPATTGIETFKNWNKKG